MKTIKPLQSLVAAALAALWYSSTAMTAEVRGGVEFEYNGIFSSDAGAQKQPIAVALLPVNGKQVALTEPQIHHMEISNNRISPSFLSAQRGDRIVFVNTDSVYHQLFSLSHDIPFDVTLEKTESGKPKQASINLDKNGTVHIFCRIHNKSYARVDVLETPYQQMISSGQPFRFSGLDAGRWLLRLASPAAETRVISVDAVTSPPPLKLQLSSHGGGSATHNLAVTPAIENMYQ